jgi:hypothetical protein
VPTNTPAPPPPEPDPIPVPIEVPSPDPQAYFEGCLDIACAHFCAFKQVGSGMRYTHVHITLPLFGSPSGSDAVTGVGHDDDTNPDDPHHNTVSYGDGRCGFEVNPSHTTIYPYDRGGGYVFEVYFIECGPDGCPEGWTRRECACGAMCWTLSHEVWERWYQGHH